MTFDVIAVYAEVFRAFKISLHPNNLEEAIDFMQEPQKSIYLPI